jgi:Fe-S cluster biosynthesis and repair protein YggX
MSCCGGGPGEEHGHKHEAAKPAPPPGTRMIFCKKFQKELPGLTYLPWNTDLGKRVYNEISEEGWKLWTEQAKMILNEYRLNLASPEAQKFLFTQAEAFFFGPGAALPPEYTPMASKK